MELRHLRYFRAVAETGSFRKAASVLNVAQPAISRQVRDLEMELGAALFDRTGRTIQLTDAGKSFLADTYEILQAVERAADTARAVEAGRDGRLRLGLLEALSWSGPAPEAFRRFSADWPNIRLDIRPMASIAQFRAIASGELDGGFAYMSRDFDGSALSHVVLRTDDVVLAAPRDHVFEHDGPVSAGEVADMPMIGFPRESAPEYFDRIQLALKQIGLTPRFVQYGENANTILSLVSAGMGCSVVNAINRDRPPKNVQFRNIDGVSVPIDLIFAFKAPAGMLMSRFLDTIGPQ